MDTNVIEEQEQESTTDNIISVEMPIVISDQENVVLSMNGNHVPPVVLEKKKKGRPNIHPFAGRLYLIKHELEAALADTDSFVTLMDETYRPSDERKEVLGPILDPPNELCYTIHGDIRQVISELRKLRDTHGDKAKVSISKDRLLNPTDDLYLQPIREVIGERKGKPVYKHLFEEFSSSRIYGYVIITF